MYYQLNNFTFIRNVNNYLQIVDKRDDSELIGDFSSWLFAKHLNYCPLDIDKIVNNICSEFVGNVDFSTVKNDAIDFFDSLVGYGLVSKNDQAKSPVEDVSKTNNQAKQATLLSKEQMEQFQTMKNQKPCLQNIIIEITQKCNERCVHCYIPHENKNSIMSDKDFYAIVDMCGGIETILNVRITGGECMSHPSFKNYIRYVKDKGFALTLLTNLTLLDDETIYILKEGTLSQVQVSMFSVNPEIHD